MFGGVKMNTLPNENNNENTLLRRRDFKRLSIHAALMNSVKVGICCKSDVVSLA